MLTFLQQRCNANWLQNFDNRRFYQSASELANCLQKFPVPPVILLAEADPFCFLSGFVAALASDCPLFLGNPTWQEREWQQVFEIVRPDLILGNLEAPRSKTRPRFPREKFDSTPILIPTGGTSGKVRFAAHTRNTLSASVAGFCQYFNVKNINSFCILPLYHVSGLMQFLRSLLSSGYFYYDNYSEFKKKPEIDRDFGEYFISLVPTQLQFLLETRPEWLARFHTVLVGGASTGNELLERARAKKIRLAPTYGMTETASQVATLKPDDFLQGKKSSGRALPHASIKILPDEKNSLNCMKAGIIAIESESLFRGYYPELLPVSRLHETDDLGYLDDRGYLHVIGRNSQKIITGGENVFPGEVEAVILATHLVVDVGIIGIPDRIWGQAIAAIYIPKAGIAIEAIQSAIATKMSKFKQPKHWLAVESLPRNTRGKVNRDRLLEIAREKLH